MNRAERRALAKAKGNTQKAIYILNRPKTNVIGKKHKRMPMVTPNHELIGAELDNTGDRRG